MTNQSLIKPLFILTAFLTLLYHQTSQAQELEQIDQQQTQQYQQILDQQQNQLGLDDTERATIDLSDNRKALIPVLTSYPVDIAKMPVT